MCIHAESDYLACYRFRYNFGPIELTVASENYLRHQEKVRKSD